MSNYLKSLNISAAWIAALISIAVIFTHLSVRWTTDTVYVSDDMAYVKLGWPIPFEIQDHSTYKSDLPSDERFILGTTTGIDVLALIASLTINVLIAIMLYVLVLAFFQLRRRR